MPNCKVIAEIGINHNGDLDIAKQMINKAFLAGCDAVKFQKRDVDLVYSEEELSKQRESPWGDTNRDQKYGLEFNKSDYHAIDEYAIHTCGIPWFASPWDINSVDFLNQFDTEYIKIASASITDFELLEKIKATDKKIIISTGMSSRDEICKAVEYLNSHIEYVLACTSTYPTKPSEMNLEFINTLRRQFPKHRIGFSNHSTSVAFITAAMSLAAEMIEFHFTLDRSLYGSDQAASIEPHGMKLIVRNARILKEAMGDGQWQVFESEKAIRDKLRKTVKHVSSKIVCPENELIREGGLGE